MKIYTSTSEIPFIHLKPDRVPLSGKASPYRPFIRITFHPPPPTPAQERTIFFTPTVIVKYMKKNLDIKKPSYSEQILTSLALAGYTWDPLFLGGPLVCLFVCLLRHFALIFVD